MGTEKFSFGTPGILNQDDSQLYVLATEFTPSINGSWTGNEWYAAATNDGQNHYILAYVNGAFAGSKLISPTFGGGLQAFSFTSPIAITAGDVCEACVITQHYTATSLFFASTDATTPHLTAPHASNGRFNPTSPDTAVFPGGIFSNCYHVSPIVVFPGENHNVTCAAALSLVPALAKRKGAREAVELAIGLATSEHGHKLNASVTAAGLLDFALSVQTNNPEAAIQTGSWWGLVAILTEAAQEERWQHQRTPMACPNDGEPLRSGPGGVLFCPFDGWRWEP